MSESEEYLAILQLSDEEAIRDLEQICQSMVVMKAKRANRRANLAQTKLQALNDLPKQDQNQKQKQKQKQEQDQQQQKPGEASKEDDIEVEDISDSNTLLNCSVQSEPLENQAGPQVQVKAEVLSPPASSVSRIKRSSSYLDGKTFGNRHRALLLICQKKMRPYGIPMYEFSMSFTSGHAFCAFIHSYRPDLIDPKYLKCKNPPETLRYVEGVANRLGAYFEGNFLKFMRRPRPGFVKIYNFVHQLYAILEDESRRNFSCRLQDK